MNNKKNYIKSLKGPIAVLGAGGFIGVNLLNFLSRYRGDVIGVSQNPGTSWRLNEAGIKKKSLEKCDITDYSQIKNFLVDAKPKTIFNLAAYGSYSSQKVYKKIYNTNFNVALDIIEIAKEYGFKCYVHAGSSSEYGTNSRKPAENDELSPNSHYAVSKVATSYAIKYYGKIEKLPVTNLRIYSAYGPWEEPDRLMPSLVSMAKKGKWPEFVNPLIARDFVYVDDVCEAFIMAANSIKKTSGNSYNIGTGKKTTIKALTLQCKKIFKISATPIFGTMCNRKWDLTDWHADVRKAKNEFGWMAKTSLNEGLRRVAIWQEEVKYDNAYWNYKKNNV